MANIAINTDINAPCCPCEIVNGDGRTRLIQTDCDFPGVATTFGWSVRRVQKCPVCDGVFTVPEDTDLSVSTKAVVACGDSDCPGRREPCLHSSTDGTVDCKECGLKAGDFIAAARTFLEENNGKEAEDPGYFDQEEAA